MSRWSSRRRWVRWSVVGVEALVCASYLLTLAFDDLTVSSLVSTNVAFPALTVAFLLTPGSGRWFDRSSRGVTVRTEV
jgi:hypothetical protein